MPILWLFLQRFLRVPSPFISNLLGLSGRLFLIGDSPLARALAGAGVRMSALAAGWQTTTVPQTTIRAHFYEALDVHRDFFAEVAFDCAFSLDQGTEMVDFLLGKIGDLLLWIDLRPVQKRQGACTPNAVNISQPNG
jgi:hypothetical protein